MPTGKLKIIAHEIFGQPNVYMIFVIKYGIVKTRIPERERMSPEPMDIQHTIPCILNSSDLIRTEIF